MKIEVGESLCYSYLRHVQRCWVVQTNWKVSEHWEKCLTDDELETIFQSMRQTFDPGGSVFKKTRDCAQFLRQAEIDLVGVEQDGSIHAIDVAFHEAGLNYGGGTGNRVLKKLLRTALTLMAYRPKRIKRHIYFVSPTVRPGAQQPLDDMFSWLREEFSDIEWHLFTNKTFATEMLAPTLEKGESVADMSELFLRSVKLLELGGAEAVETSLTPTTIPTNKTPESPSNYSSRKANGRKSHQEHIQNCVEVLTKNGYSVSESVGNNAEADFSAQGGGQAFPFAVKVASRVEILRRNVGKGLFTSFEADGRWYLLPHDELVSIAGRTTPWLESASWLEKGWYSTPSPSQSMLAALRDFAL